MENKYLVEDRAEQSTLEIYLIEENLINSAEQNSYFWEGYENNKNHGLLQSIKDS